MSYLFRSNPPASLFLLLSLSFAPSLFLSGLLFLLCAQKHVQKPPAVVFLRPNSDSAGACPHLSQTTDHISDLGVSLGVLAWKSGSHFRKTCLKVQPQGKGGGIALHSWLLNSRMLWPVGKRSLGVTLWNTFETGIQIQQLALVIHPSRRLQPVSLVKGWWLSSQFGGHYPKQVLNIHESSLVKCCGQR